MKKMIVLMSLCGALAALTGCGTAPQSAAAGTGAAGAALDKPEKANAPVSEGIAAIRVAYDLAKYGYSAYSASALIEAAEILSQTQTQPLGVAGETDQPAGADAQTAHPEFTPVNLLADARNFAAGDKTLLAWADKIAGSLGSATRGAVGGPREGIEVVAAQGTVTYKLPFRANEIATIFVSGDGSTDLDMYVYDENGILVGYDEENSDDCLVRLSPKWTGSFTIVVKNLGGQQNRYAIVTD
jgi:hypothetical protein